MRSMVPLERTPSLVVLIRSRAMTALSARPSEWSWLRSSRYRASRRACAAESGPASARTCVRKSSGAARSQGRSVGCGCTDGNSLAAGLLLDHGDQLAHVLQRGGLDSAETDREHAFDLEEEPHVTEAVPAFDLLGGELGGRDQVVAVEDVAQDGGQLVEDRRFRHWIPFGPSGGRPFPKIVPEPLGRPRRAPA